MDTDIHPEEIHLTILGQPAPQGSKVAFSRKGSTRVVMLEQTRKTLTPWRQAVTLQARRQYRRPAPLDVPLSVGMVFVLARPKTVRRPYPSVTPDLSKLIRSTEDALTDAAVWRDDCLVVAFHELAKVYAGPDAPLDQPGVLISICPLAAVSLPGRIAPRQGRPDARDLEMLRTAALSDAEPFSA